MGIAEPQACVVIATRDRLEGLQRCLAALDRQRDVEPFTVVVVDDGSRTPITPADLRLDRHALKLVRGPGDGPSHARNLGVAASDEPVVFFTDDDTIPGDRWIAGGLAALRDDAVVAVDGPVTTPAYDQLYEYSIATSGAGHFWTCNVAYRREALDAVGGFDVATFPRYREDRDLGYRVAQLGPTAFCEDMRIEHTPRRVALGDLYRLTVAEVADIPLRERHPAHFQFETRVPVALTPIAGSLRRTAQRARAERSRRWRIDRMARLLLVSAVELAGSAYVASVNLRHAARRRSAGVR